MVMLMRTFYIFKIKEEYAHLTKNNPYHLFKMLSYIYNIDREEIKRGADLFYKMVERFRNKEFDNKLFKKYQDNFFYTKFKNIHQINNIYKKEESKLIVHQHFLLLKSTIIRPTFLQDLEELENLFLCDFENKDYFWLEKLTTNL